MDAHLTRVVRAMGGMISFVFLYISNIWIRKRCALQHKNSCVQFIFFQLVHLAAGVNSRPATDKKHTCVTGAGSSTSAAN
jgi:hypothetical protein